MRTLATGVTGLVGSHLVDRLPTVGHPATVVDHPGRGKPGVVGIFAEAMLAGRPTTRYGHGGNTRDDVYVTGAVAAVLAASGVRGCQDWPRRATIGSGLHTRNRDLPALVAAAVGTADVPDYAPARLADPRASAQCATAAEESMAWAPTVDPPTVDPPTGITRTVAHLRRSMSAHG